jgi:X-Pro dipeptidyl-peptidase (S15 family)
VALFFFGQATLSTRPAFLSLKHNQPTSLGMHKMSVKLTGRLLVVFFTTVFTTLACSQLRQENYQVGFSVSRTVDKSRLYKANGKPSDYLYHRPLDIDVWYPAQDVSADSLLVFGDFLDLLEKRANYYTGSTASVGFSGQIADYLSTGIRCSDSTKVLSYRTNSYRNAKPAEGKFPLIVYVASYNGMGHENYLLFEEWARKGFVVVSINSIGRYPGDMTMKNGDLMEQVNDALFSIDYMKSNPHVDFSKIGIVGYSWGGLAGTLVANNVKQTACLLSLDGSEFHHYGTSREEDVNFEGTVNSPYFKKMALSIPYLRLESDAPVASTAKDSIYDFLMRVTAEKRVVKIASAAHEDFSCLPTTVLASGECPDNRPFLKIMAMSTTFLEKYLK